jgi:Pro-kumamolisin, activation domain/Divergent InlB B-repeat domain
MKNKLFRRLFAAQCAVLLFLTADYLRAAVPTGQKILSGHVPVAIARLNLQPLGSLSGSTNLHLAIGLPLHNQDELANLLQQIYDPTSPNYHHFLTPAEFTAQFGPTEGDYQNVINFAQTNGLTVTRIYDNRMVIDVDGKVSDVERSFHVTLRMYHHPTEARDFFAPDTEPTVDASLPILHVQGINNYFLPRPMLHKVPVSGGGPAAGSGPGGGYMGQDFRNAYLPSGTLDGSGQLVGLLQFDGYNPNDIAKYESLAGLPNVPLQNILLDGFNGSAGANNDEVCLDIETSISMAPALTGVVVFEAGPAGNPDDILSAMAADNQIKQFSASWGYDTDATTEQLYKQLAIQGQTFLNASGDGDAWVGPIPFGSCEDSNITIIGGTTLTMSGRGVSYVSEKAWNWGNVGDYNWNPDGYAGTSGGISTDVGIPSWQQGISMTSNHGSTTFRNVPDVALTADNVFVVSSGGEYGSFGGTSCASPLWAGFMALVNQRAAANGNAPVGFLAPTVYALAKTANYTNCFHDIIAGDNTWDQSPSNFFAVPGYDLCTGLGTPNGENLIDALAGRPPRTGFLTIAVSPSSGSTLLNASTQAVFVSLSDPPGYGITNGTVTASVAGVTNLTLLDNGQPPDVASNDGIYSATFSIPASGDSLTMTVTSLATNEIGATNVISYSLVPLPPNDNFANAIKVPASGGSYLSNNRFATIETNEPAHDGDTDVAASLWWSWTPSTSTNVFIDTIDSKIDTVLAVYTGDALTALQQVAATNGNAAQFKPAYLRFNASAGTTYRIVVASVSSNSLGSLALHITPGGQLNTNPPVVSITSPQSGLTVTNPIISLSGVAVDPLPNFGGVSQISVTVNGSTTLASGTTNWASIASLQSGLNIIQVSAIDAAGNVSSPATTEVNYLLLGPPNDFFANALPLTTSPEVDTGSNVNATKEDGEPNHAGIAGGKSVWWYYQPPGDGVLTLNTTNSTFDTLLGLYTGTNVANLTTIAGNDDAYPGAPDGFSIINQAVRSGQLYYIAVDGYDGATGMVSLSYSFVPATVYHLTVLNTPGGTVQLTTTNALGGIAIAPGQSGDFANGSTVMLTAIPDISHQFNNWSNNLSGNLLSSSNPFIVTVNGDMNLTANFDSIAYTDGFESGNLLQLPWTTAGGAPWFVQTDVVDQGVYAARSGIITNNQSSSLILATNFYPGTGSFDYKISSEPIWDTLNFYIDGVLVQQWSGEAGWANYTFPLTAGPHTLEWSYVKDPTESDGLDAAFIDDVNLPLLASGNSAPPQLQFQRQSSGGFLMTLTGQDNQQYVIQTSTDLVNWQNLSTNTATGGIIQITIPANGTNRAQFYRALVP